MVEHIATNLDSGQISEALKFDIPDNISETTRDVIDNLHLPSDEHD